MSLLITTPPRSLVNASVRTLLLLAGSTAFASAAQTIYSGPLLNTNVRFAKEGNSVSYQAPVVGAGTQISVDPVGQNLTFQKFEIQTSAFTIAEIVSFTTGFGVTKDYGIAINFDAYSIEVGDGGVVHSLTPGTGGNFGIDFAGPNGSYVTPTFSFNLTGTYSVAGLTESVTGSFSVPVTGYAEISLPDTLHTSGFPNQLELSKFNYQFETFLSLAGENPPNTDFFSRTVEGQQITWGMAYIHTGSEYGPLAPGALVIPEPSALLLGCVGVLGLVRRRR